jgi:GTP-binding protein
LECKVPFALVFTKEDKQSPAKTRATVKAFLETLPEELAGIPPVITSSSKSRTGRIAILKLIEQALAE